MYVHTFPICSAKATTASKTRSSRIKSEPKEHSTQRTEVRARRWRQLFICNVDESQGNSIQTFIVWLGSPFPPHNVISIIIYFQAKRKLFNKNNHHQPHNKFELPFIKSQAARRLTSSKNRKQSKLLISRRQNPIQDNPKQQHQHVVAGGAGSNLPSSSWNQFLSGMRGSKTGESGSGSEMCHKKAMLRQPHNEAEVGCTCFTTSELVMAFDFIRRTGATSEINEADTYIGGNDFSRSCRVVMKARNKQALERSVWQLVLVLDDVLRRTGETLRQWFQQFHDEDEDGDEYGDDFLTHYEFETAIRTTCDELGVSAIQTDEDIAVLTRYFDPHNSGKLKCEVTQAGIDRAHVRLDPPEAISQSGPVLLYLIECLQEQQKRPQDFFRSLLPRGSKTLNFPQFREAIDNLSLIFSPSSALLAEYGSLLLRRQADAHAALLAERDHSGPTDVVEDEIPVQRLVQYHMTHGELRDVNNYRYFLLCQQEKDRVQRLQQPRSLVPSSPHPTYSYKHSKSSPRAVNRHSSGPRTDIPGRTNAAAIDVDYDIEQVRELERKDAELKHEMEHTSIEMNKLTLSLLNTQESCAVVEAVSLALQKEKEEKRMRRVKELEEQEEALQKALHDTAIDMQRSLHTLDSVSISSSPSHKRVNKKTKALSINDSHGDSITSTPSMPQHFSPTPPQGGRGRKNFRGQHVKEVIPGSPIGIKFNKKTSSDFSP